MTEVLSFPGLGWELPLSRIAFSIGGVSFYWYGILFALGFIAGMIFFQRRVLQAGIHPNEGIDVIFWAVAGGLIGARAYFVAFRWDLYKDDLLKMFAFREGGIAMYGGVIGAILVGWLVCRIKRLPLRPMLDAALPGLLLAQGIGRWGNFVNIEAFGSNTTLPWGMTSPSIQNYLFSAQTALAAQGVEIDPSLPVHPTFFYESMLNLAGFLVLAFVIFPRRRYDGQVALWYMAWYGLCRAVLEGLRTDSLMWGPVRVSQVLGLLLFILSTGLLIFCRVRLQQGKELPMLYARTPESIQRVAREEEQLNQKGGKTKDQSSAMEEDASIPQEDALAQSQNSGVEEES